MRVAIGFLVVALLLCGSVSADDAIGRVKTSEGEAFVVHQGIRQAATVGTWVFSGDAIVTGGDGAVGVTFRDNTMISVGPDTNYVIDEFVFAPSDQKLSFVSRMSKGTLHFVSGKIAKLSPESVKVATPTGTLGVRGTRFVLKIAP